MKIEITKNDSTMTVFIEGGIDSVTAPEFENTLKSNSDGIQHIILDFSNASYVASAGLRVILLLSKTMSAQKGTLILKNVNSGVREVFALTGFDEFLHFE